MKKVKKLAEILFIACIVILLTLTGACEQDSINIKEYIVYSSITLAVLLWSGIKGQLIHK